MNDPRPAFLFYVAEFWTSEAVESMDFESVGLYLFLLGRQWQTGYVPDDAELLRRLCRGRAADFDAAWSVVRPCFELCADGRLRNAKLERVRADADARSAAQSTKAKSRWKQWREEQAKKRAQSPAVVPRHSPGNAEVMPGLEGIGMDGIGRERRDPPSPQGGGAPDGAGLDKPDASPRISSRKARRGGNQETWIWDELWSELRMGTEFAWTKADAVQMAAALKLANGDRAELARRIRALLTSSDRWMAQNASPRILVSKWNALTVEVRPAAKANATDDQIRGLFAKVGLSNGVRGDGVR